VSPTARSLGELANGGAITAVFNAGTTGGGHHWQLLAQDGCELARSERVHNGGAVRQAFWQFITATGLDANNDIHVDVIGADDHRLARATASYMKEAVTVTDPDGRQIVSTKRDKKVVTVYGTGDAAIAEFNYDGDGPWPVRSPAGEVLGELLAGDPGPSLNAPLWQWLVDTQWALNTTTYRRAMHLGLRRVNRYAFAPAGRLDPALALLPLLCGLSY